MPSTRNSRFGGERFRGSSEIPITPEGLEGAKRLAFKLAMKGGVDRIMTSNMGRTLSTAKILSQYTHAPITYVGDGLHPWHLGFLEGQEVTPELLDYQNRLVREAPEEKIPGRGPLSVADGESFNTFKNRALEFYKQVIAGSRARPEEKTALVTHYRNKRLLDAWMRTGMQDDNVIDPDTMTTKNNDPPGSISKLYIDAYAGPQMKNIDLDSTNQLGGGLYIIRHESTPWNSKQGGAGTGMIS